MDAPTKEVYTPAETTTITGIEKETLRKYTSEFNIQTEWTQPDQKGHRRYTKENIEMLIAIKEKIQNQNWSWKQVKSWLNGEEEIFSNYTEQTKLEKKIDQILKQQEQQEQFNAALVQKLDQMHQENREMKNSYRELKKSFDENEKKLLESIDKKQNKNFFQKLFGK